MFQSAVDSSMFDTKETILGANESIVSITTFTQQSDPGNLIGIQFTLETSDNRE